MHFYMTPVAISYLTQLILAVLITAYLFTLLRGKPAQHTRMLAGFFFFLTLFVGLGLFESASLPTQRLYAVYLQNMALGIALVFLLQFVYHFPAQYPSRRIEALAAGILASLYALWEGGYAVFRFMRISEHQVVFRPLWSDVFLILLFAWVPIACFRQLLAMPHRAKRTGSDPTPISHRDMRGEHVLRGFIVVFLFVAGLSSLTYFENGFLIPSAMVSLCISVGILLAVFAFVQVYLGSRVETTSFMIRLAGATLAVMLVVLGIVGWIIAPVYSGLYRPDLPGGLTLRFTPNARQGYDLEQLPLAFEPELGQRLDVLVARCGQALDFTFPFFGQVYSTVYACGDGVINLGTENVFMQYEYQYGGDAPLLAPLLVHLSVGTPTPEGVYARQESDRLVITWSDLPGRQHTGERYTFQAVLYANGAFAFHYKDLPASYSYHPSDIPGAHPWLIGVLPAGPRTASVITQIQEAPAAIGPGGMIADFDLDFRHFLDHLLRPLGWLILFASLLIVMGFPLLLHASLVRPLNSLLSGVRRMQAGDYSLNLPEHASDEIGFLTSAFSRASIELGDLIRNLETRVAERTRELAEANAQLRIQIKEHERDQATILEQQRSLAAIEERERLGRELHDGLGQMMGYVNVQVQAVQALLAERKLEAAHTNLDNLAQSARDAYQQIRGQILDLRTQDLRGRAFFDVVRQVTESFSQKHGIAAMLVLPERLPSALFGPAEEEQVLRIIQEALTNAAKHSRASRVEVIFSLVGEHVQVMISDDGVGFDTALQANTRKEGVGSFGLGIMRERAEQAGGTLEVRSAPGRGTWVIASLPRFLPNTAEGIQPGVKGLRVLLADDHPLFLDGLRNLLTARGLTVVAVAHDGREAFEKTQLLLPDVTVLDLNMPVMNGLEATKAIKAATPDVKVVMLTAAEDETALFEAIKSGASGYLLKSLEANHFCDLLTGLMSGEVALAPGMAGRVMQEFVRQAVQPAAPAATQPAAGLSARQLEILRMAADGLTYKEIGAVLHLTEKTIKYHMGQILDRLHLKNRSQAIAYLKNMK